MYVAKDVLKVDKKQLDGREVGIAFIDTGITSHADFVLGENKEQYLKEI